MLHCGTIASDCTLSGSTDSRSWRGRIADDTISCVDVFRNTIAIGTLSGNILFSDLQRVGSRYKAVVRSTVGRLDASAPHAPANVLKYSPCGDYLAMGTIKGDVMVIQVSRGNLGGALRILYLECVHPQGSVLNLAWSHDSYRLYSGCTLGVVHEHINETSSWSGFSFAASMLGVSADRVISRFKHPINNLCCSFFTVPNSTNKTDVIVVSVNYGIYFCYSVRNHSSSPWKSAFIPNTSGQSLLFNSTLGFRFEASVSGSPARKPPVPSTELLVSLERSGGDEAVGCGVECANIAVYDCKTSLKIRNETVYQSIYSTTTSRLAHSNKVKLRDDLDVTAFSQLVPMQADDNLAIFFGVTTSHRLAIVHLNGGCFNVIDLFKYVHKVVVSGSNVYILHSSSSSGVMLVDLIRIVFVDVDTNRVAFPLYSYRLHAAIVTLQRYGKVKIKNKPKHKGGEAVLLSPKQSSTTPSSLSPLRPARLVRTQEVRESFNNNGHSPIPYISDIKKYDSPIRSITEISQVPSLSSVPLAADVEQNEDDDGDDDNGDSFMKETEGTWLERWKEGPAVISDSKNPSDWTKGLNHPFLSAPPSKVGDSKGSWLQNAYSSGTYLLSVPYAGTTPPSTASSWIEALPLRYETDGVQDNSISTSVRDRVSTRRRTASLEKMVLRKNYNFPDLSKVSERVPDSSRSGMESGFVERCMIDKIDEFLKFKQKSKRMNRNANTTDKYGSQDEGTIYEGGLLNIEELAVEDFERRTYTVSLPLYPSCGTGIKFDLLPDGGLIVIDFVSSVKLKGVAESPYAASCGLINVGDVLVGIDGVSLYNIGLQAVAKKLQELVKGAKEKKSSLMRFEYGDYEELKPELNNTAMPSAMSDLLTNTAYAMGGSAALEGYKRNEPIQEARSIGISDITSRLPNVRSALGSAKVSLLRFDGRSYLHWRNRLGQGGPAPQVDSWNLGYSDDEDECVSVLPNGIVMADTVHDALRKRSVYGDCGVLTCQAGPFQHLLENNPNNALALLAERVNYWKCRVNRAAMPGYFRGYSAGGKTFSNLIKDEVYIIPSLLNECSSGKDFRRCLISHKKVEFLFTRSKRDKTASTINKAFQELMQKMYSRRGQLILRMPPPEAVCSVREMAISRARAEDCVIPAHSDLRDAASQAVRRIEKSNKYMDSDRIIEYWESIFAYISICCQELIYHHLVESTFSKNRTLVLYENAGERLKRRQRKRTKTMTIFPVKETGDSSGGSDSGEVDSSSSSDSGDEAEWSVGPLNTPNKHEHLRTSVPSALKLNAIMDPKDVFPRKQRVKFCWSGDICASAGCVSVSSSDSLFCRSRSESRHYSRARVWVEEWLSIFCASSQWDIKKTDVPKHRFVPMSHSKLLFELKETIGSGETIGFKVVPLTMLLSRYCIHELEVIKILEAGPFGLDLIKSVLNIWYDAIRPGGKAQSVQVYKSLYADYCEERGDFGSEVDVSYGGSCFVLILQGLLSLRLAVNVCPKLISASSVNMKTSRPGCCPGVLNLMDEFSTESCLLIFGVALSPSNGTITAKPTQELKSSMHDMMNVECNYWDLKEAEGEFGESLVIVSLDLLLKIFTSCECDDGVNTVLRICEKMLISRGFVSVNDLISSDRSDVCDYSNIEDIVLNLKTALKCFNLTDLSLEGLGDCDCRLAICVIALCFKRCCCTGAGETEDISFSACDFQCGYVFPPALIALIHPTLTDFYVQKLLLCVPGCLASPMTSTTTHSTFTALLSEGQTIDLAARKRLETYWLALRLYLADENCGMLHVNTSKFMIFHGGQLSVVLVGISIILSKITEIERLRSPEVICQNGPGNVVKMPGRPVAIDLNMACGCTCLGENIMSKSSPAKGSIYAAAIENIVRSESLFHCGIGESLIQLCVQTGFVSGLLVIAENFVANSKSFLRESPNLRQSQPTNYLNLTYQVVESSLTDMLRGCVASVIEARRRNNALLVRTAPLPPTDGTDGPSLKRGASVSGEVQVSDKVQNSLDITAKKGGPLYQIYDSVSAVSRGSIKAVGKGSRDAVSAVGKAILPSGVDDSLAMLRNRSNQKLAIQAAVTMRKEAKTPPRGGHSGSTIDVILLSCCSQCRTVLDALCSIIITLKSTYELNGDLHPEARNISVQRQSRIRFMDKMVMDQVVKVISEVSGRKEVGSGVAAVDNDSITLILSTVKNVVSTVIDKHQDYLSLSERMGPSRSK